MPQPGQRTGHVNRRAARCCTAVAIIIALATIFAIIRDANPRYSSSSAHHRGDAASKSFLIPDSVELQQQLSAIDWRACLQPREEEVPMTKDQFLQQKPARLRLEHLRLSTFKSPVGVTVLVTYGAARLAMLDGLCDSWGGHISAAVFQSRHGNGSGAPSDTVFQIDDIWKRAERGRRCALDVALYSENAAPDDKWMPDLFPVNSLRSRALLLARTPLVLVLDGDMLVHSALHARLARERARYETLLQGAAARTYHVLPALETPHTALAYDVAYGSKAACLEQMALGRVTRFNVLHPYPQNCTDYERWKIAPEAYRVTYCKRYEPWGIVDRQQMPWFDVRFRGYGRNKIVFTAALNASGFDFEVDADSFIIHRPHEATSASHAFGAKAELQGHLIRMYNEQRDAGVFRPVLDDSVEHCRAQLPWWQ